MSAQCLSVCGPCTQICEACQRSYDNYYEQAQKKAIADARRVLEAFGYTVIEPREIEL